MLGILALIGVITIGLVSVFTAAFAVGATALIVPGTGTPNPNAYPEYVQDARNYYLRNTVCGETDECTNLGQNLVGIDYPASFWPLSIIPGWCEADCQKWDVSVADGVTNLETAVKAALSDPEQRVVIYGHSQGAAVVSNTLRNLNTSLNADEKARVQVVVTGNVDNPAGGMWSRIGFLGRIPIIDLTTGLPTPTDTGITFTSIAMQYDGASNAPKYWGNPLALVNAIAGFAYLHGTTLIPDERTPVGVPDYYPTVDEYLAAVYDPANAKQDAHGNTYIVVPSPTLPIVLPFLDIAARTGTTAFVKPITDLVSPTLRVLIDLGYDPDENPGVYSPLSILPFSPRTNPIEVAADLVEAVGQGIHDAVHGGATLPVPPRVSLSAAPRTSTATVDLDDADAPDASAPVRKDLNALQTTTTVSDDGPAAVPNRPTERLQPTSRNSLKGLLSRIQKRLENNRGRTGSVFSGSDDQRDTTTTSQPDDEVTKDVGDPPGDESDAAA